MRHVVVSLLALACAPLWSDRAAAGASRCPPDSAKVGNVCIDLYEASVWQIDPSNAKLIGLVRAGKATRATLMAGGAKELSLASSPLALGACDSPFPASFPSDGNWTPKAGSERPSPGVYAASIPGVLPTGCITWFQANQACLLSGKRLLTNREWQGAAAGTPDVADDGATTCVTDSMTAAANTGSRAKCKSSWGVFDMVGNVDEWVGDWADKAHGCTDWTGLAGVAGDDLSCFGGPGDPGGDDPAYSIPGALIRGGRFDSGTSAGVFAVRSADKPSDAFPFIGFRCAR
jgi:sulfatase-modifying factor enzyme 1